MRYYLKDRYYSIRVSNRAVDALVYGENATLRAQSLFVAKNSGVA